MNNEKPQESSVPAQEVGETEHGVAIDALPVALGFIETGELKEIRDRLQQAYESNDAATIQSMLELYSIAGIPVVEQYQDSEYAQAQIGRIIAKAILYRNIGRAEDFAAEMDDALTYAENMGYEEIVSVLSLVIEEAEN